MLASCSRQDAEDVLQDVFVRAYGALRNDNREMNVRAWLYRVAHNRCIDHLRRPVPPAAEIFEVSRKPLHDPVEEAQRRDDLRQLVADVGNLPEQQRSALLMREMNGMTYADLANALDVTVPAVKSLLVRARVGLVEAAEARDADCMEIHADLLRAYDRGVKASGRARKHMRSCDGCTEYRDRAARHAALVRRAGAGRRRPARAGREGPRSVRRRRCRGGRRGRRRRWRGRGRRRHRGRDRLQGRRGRLHGGDRHRRRGRGQAPGLQRPTAGRGREARGQDAHGGRGQAHAPGRRRARRPPAGRATAAARAHVSPSAPGQAASARPSTGRADKPREVGTVAAVPARPQGRPRRRRPGARRRDPQAETGGARAPDAPPAATPAVARARRRRPRSRRRSDHRVRQPRATAPRLRARPPHVAAARPRRREPLRRHAPRHARRTARGRPLGCGAIADYPEPLAHETLLVRRGRRSGLFTMVAVHSTARGPALGGCRMWTYDDSRAAVRDVLRLSRAMTFKAAVAGLPLGGGKGVIMLRPDEAVLTPERREAVLQDFGDTVEALGGDYLTAEDVGTGEPRHGGDRGPHQARHRPRLRLRRSEPVDRAGLRGRGPRHRASARSAPTTSTAAASR